MSPEDRKQGKESGTLVTRLAPPPQPSAAESAAPRVPPVPKPQPPPEARRSPPPVQESPRRPDVPRVLAPEAPVSAPTPPPVQSASPPSTPRPPAEDFAANVEARRRAREAAANAAPTAPSGSSQDRIETEKERHSREVAANLGLNAPQTFGAERNPGGGMFQVQSMTSDEAQLFFFGWNKDIRRNARQVLTVRRGSDPSIQIALVRRMIAIIRDHETGDFIWESPRLGRNVTLSARMADNAGLEDFLMREFFPEYAARR